MVARDRFARGVRLNYPEAVALLSTWVIERARQGVGVPELMITVKACVSISGYRLTLGRRPPTKR
ncbi:urease subunit gamma [Actinopolymorpha pittospori]